eukprot:3284_1
MIIYNSGSFLDIVHDENNQGELNALISDNIFNNVSVADFESAIIHIYGAHFASNNVVLENISFLKVDKNIIYGDGIPFNLFNINISTSKLIQWNETEFLFMVGNSKVNMSNVNIVYEIAHRLVDNCWAYSYATETCISDGIGSQILTWHSTPIQFIQYYCHSPIPFIHIFETDGDTAINIQSISVQNDISQTSLNNARQQLFAKEIKFCSLTEDAPAEISYDERFTVGLISNTGGKLTVNYLNLIGVGTSNVILLQSADDDTGYVEISHLNVDYNAYCTSPGACRYDPYALNINTYVFHLDDGILNISNSNLYGAWTILDLENGKNYIINSTFQFSPIAIRDSFQTLTVNVFNCNFSHIGKYYTFEKWRIEASKALA